MKNRFLYSMGTKITAFFLLAVFIIITAASGVLSVVCLSEFYDNSNPFAGAQPDYFNSRMFQRTADSAAQEIYYLAQSEEYDAVKKNYLENNSTARVKIFDDNGEELLNNTLPGDEKMYSYVGECYYYNEYEDEETVQYKTIELYFKPNEKFASSDSFSDSYRLYLQLFDAKGIIFTVFVVSAVIFIILTIYLMCASGHRNGADGFVLSIYDRLPLEIPLCLTVLPLLFIDSFYGNDVFILMILAIFAFIAVTFLCTLSARIKCGTLLKNTLVYRILHLLYRFFKWLANTAKRLIFRMPILWRYILAFAAWFIINFVLTVFLINVSPIFLLILVMSNTAVLALICIAAVNINKIKEGSRAIANGNLESWIDSSSMLPEFKEIAESLNNVRVANTKAIESARKNERTKAELITNVSHDIKTPLTSIINYVDLLKKEPLESQKAREYLEVIDRQSARLKKLTYDLIDASKASAGNIEVNFAPIEIVEFINQAAAEYFEKLDQQGLTPILNTTDEPIYINADGELLWRVIDNLLSNACKYSQPHTRVYIGVEKKLSKAVISVKNISKYILNISPDELTERFTRGDSSRNTEGSGLGLSIAKDLTSLQHGELNINIDCDLFKAEVVFNTILPPVQKQTDACADNSSDETNANEPADSNESQTPDSADNPNS